MKDGNYLSSEELGENPYKPRLEDVKTAEVTKSGIPGIPKEYFFSNDFASVSYLKKCANDRRIFDYLGSIRHFSKIS